MRPGPRLFCEPCALVPVLPRTREGEVETGLEHRFDIAVSSRQRQSIFP
jgi:hypothetical protein